MMASLNKESAGAETEFLLYVAVLRDGDMWRLACKLIVIVLKLYIKL